ncbi:hypothetical protein AFL01nite_23210 [Aeromicrobium flavum]|uniref:DUF2510 domain-containing protein n=1 Tax=Aeromicrobium flavum TaxID=416568 RepID=A0A512HX36_9ACTN|nr:DUF2510 domain-containing protein [Aeromicrobium flavum]GEO89994.1 hypothetical protein AFL01nite_23210 [Aeromicrobium flavum]
MTHEQVPAGWYDDPAGSGGKRFWNGRSWTERVEGGAAGLPFGRLEARSRATGPSRSSRAQDRIPDGFMLLNGHQVRIGAGLPQEPQRTVNVRGIVLAVVVAALLLAWLVGLASSIG